MICKHQFVKISDLSKPRHSPVPTMIGIAGAEAGCINCGQIRKVWADGRVEISHTGNKPIDEDDEERI